MTIKIEVFSDYVCPYCFLAEFPLEAAIKDKDVEVEWMPFELRPYPQPTLRPEEDYLQTVWRQSVYPLARKIGVEIKLPSISPQPYTHLAFEGYQYAKEHGLANKYNDRILRAFFQEHRDISKVDVLTQLAQEIGLDEKEFKQVLETRKYQTVHQSRHWNTLVKKSGSTQYRHLDTISKRINANIGGTKAKHKPV